MKKNKITIWTCLSNPNGWRNPGTYGGGEVITRDIISNLSSSFHVILCQHDQLVKSSNKIDTFIINLPFSPTKKIIYDIFNFIAWTFKTCFNFIKVSGSVQIIYAATTNASDFIPSYICAKLFNKKLVVKCHITIYEDYKGIWSIIKNYRSEKNRLIDSIIRSVGAMCVLTLLKKTDKIFAVTEHVASTLICSKIDPKKIVVINNGIDLQKIRLSISKNTKKFDLCFMSRLERYKGIFDFLNLCKKIKSNNKKSKIKAIVIGSGSAYTEALVYSKKNGLSDIVEFKGFFPGDDKYQLIHASKLFILPSTAKEGWGLVIAESLACGTPVVTYKNNIFEEVFGDIKYVSLVENFSEMVLKTEKLLKQTADWSKVSRSIKKYDISNTVRREEHEFSSVLQQG